MDTFIELLKEVNVIQIFVILFSGWFFYNRLDQKIEKLDHKINNSVDGLTIRIDRLSEKVEDVDKRLCRIEGSLASQGHCLFSQTKSEQKVQ